MSDIITTQGRTAYTIAAEIRAHSSQFIFSTFEIGRLLIEAKALVPAGEWMEYLKNELGYKQSTANNFMRIYKKWNVDGHLPESQTFGNLSPSQALELLALPDGEREEFMEQNDVASMSVRELKAAIRERDDALKAQESAEAENRDLQQALLDAQQQVAAAKSSEGAWQKEVDKLNALINKATADADRAKRDLADFKKSPTVPDALKKKISAEAVEKAVADTQKRLQENLDAAQNAAQIAAKAREEAERRVQELERQMSESQKASMFADPNTAALKFLFDQLQSDFNKANGYLMKLTSASPETGAKFKDAFRTLVDEMRKRLA